MIPMSPNSVPSVPGGRPAPMTPDSAHGGRTAPANILQPPQQQTFHICCHDPQINFFFGPCFQHHRRTGPYDPSNFSAAPKSGPSPGPFEPPGPNSDGGLNTDDEAAVAGEDRLEPPEPPAGMVVPPVGDVGAVDGEDRPEPPEPPAGMVVPPVGDVGAVAGEDKPEPPEPPAGTVVPPVGDVGAVTGDDISDPPKPLAERTWEDFASSSRGWFWGNYFWPWVIEIDWGTMVNSSSAVVPSMGMFERIVSYCIILLLAAAVPSAGCHVMCAWFQVWLRKDLKNMHVMFANDSKVFVPVKFWTCYGIIWCSCLLPSLTV